MLAKLLSRLAQPLPSRGHDGLFTTFAPNGVSAVTLRALYHQYDDAFADEPIPPQHTRFRALVKQIVSEKTDGLGLQRMRAAYENDVAVLPPPEVEHILRAGGFGLPVRFYQAGLIHAWYSRNTSGTDA